MLTLTRLLLALPTTTPAGAQSTAAVRIDASAFHIPAVARTFQMPFMVDGSETGRRQLAPGDKRVPHFKEYQQAYTAKAKLGKYKQWNVKDAESRKYWKDIQLLMDEKLLERYNEMKLRNADILRSEMNYWEDVKGLPNKAEESFTKLNKELKKNQPPPMDRGSFHGIWNLTLIQCRMRRDPITKMRSTTGRRVLTTKMRAVTRR